MSTKLLPLLLGILLLPSAAFATVTIKGTVIATTSKYIGGKYPYKWYVATRHDNGNLYYYWKSQNRSSVYASGGGWYMGGLSLNAIGKFDTEAQSTIINNLIGVDTDKDGQNDYKELAFGSDYNDANSVPSTPIWVNADTGTIYYYNDDGNITGKIIDGTITAYENPYDIPQEMKERLTIMNCDNDEYSDYEELMYGSDPLDMNNYPAIPISTDKNLTLTYTDTNGNLVSMTTAGIITTITDLTSVDDTTAAYFKSIDTDGDTENDWLELKWGSNPNDANSTATNSTLYNALTDAGYTATRNSNNGGTSADLPAGAVAALTDAGYSTESINDIAANYTIAESETGDGGNDDDGDDDNGDDDNDDTGDDDTGDDDDNDDDSEPSTTDEILQEINDKLGDADDYPETQTTEEIQQEIESQLSELKDKIDTAYDNAIEQVREEDLQNADEGNAEAMDEVQNMLNDANAGDSTNLLEQSKDAIKSVFMVDVDRAKNGTFENYFQIKLPSKVYPQSLTFEWTYYQIPFDPEEWQLSKAKTIICNVRDWIYVTMSALLFIYWSKAMMALTQKTVD